MKQNAFMCSDDLYQRALEIIKEFESCKLEAYDDGGGVWTIGWGSIEGVFPGMKITREEAVKRLSSDFLWKAVAPVAKLVNADLNENQLEALYSFVFNIGEPQFRDSDMLRLINSGADKDTIAAEFARWRYDNGKVIDGLVNRRAKEKEIFLS